MISSQEQHHIEDFDNVIVSTDPDFSKSGLKSTSFIRVGRLAVVDMSILLGSIGEIDPDRLAQVKANLVNWLTAN